MHWINFPLITIMIWSGLRIYWAFDEFAFGILDWQLFAFFPDWFNETLGLERRLARGIAFHLSFGWLFTLNGLAYVIYLAVTGGWRQLVPTWSQVKRAPATLLHEVGLRKEAPPSDADYNAAQQLSYTVIVVLGFVVILSGFALFRPVQLSFLVSMMGGFQGARLVHFTATMAFLAFFVIHIFQVIRSGRSNMLSMITGYEVVTVEPTDEPTLEVAADIESEMADA